MLKVLVQRLMFEWSSTPGATPIESARAEHMAQYNAPCVMMYMMKPSALSMFRVC